MTAGYREDERPAAVSDTDPCTRVIGCILPDRHTGTHDVGAPPLKPLEHAPGHPIGAQAGPHGRHALWCRVEGCDWRDIQGGR